jgi:hypothetical protein
MFHVRKSICLSSELNKHAPGMVRTCSLWRKDQLREQELDNKITLPNIVKKSLVRIWTLHGCLDTALNIWSYVLSKTGNLLTSWATISSPKGLYFMLMLVSRLWEMPKDTLMALPVTSHGQLSQDALRSSYGNAGLGPDHILIQVPWKADRGLLTRFNQILKLVWNCAQDPRGAQ